ncbi:hypothetical protein L596_002476 [Steinernema carpocapsae]|uniref:Uncharacterized protein n=1 Tax=Steinernema carpocapsae TaxID=34508 RepID=A0A4U8UPQ2_STECR|nr:hypothetical protein L596_002476 [Steinernema carpocapsae]
MQIQFLRGRASAPSALTLSRQSKAEPRLFTADCAKNKLVSKNGSGSPKEELIAESNLCEACHGGKLILLAPTVAMSKTGSESRLNECRIDFRHNGKGNEGSPLRIHRLLERRGLNDDVGGPWETAKHTGVRWFK